MYLLLGDQYVWLVLAMLIFMGIFFGFSIWAMRVDQALVNEWQRLPLTEHGAIGKNEVSDGKST